ncbi:MAG TPA: alpha-2-macroglobulin family protein, partial [Candidatus Elarobacter sp.]|nr:alpha-2-macroglobulin family protein [Candidatus Elarobacter sp.]
MSSVAPVGDVDTLAQVRVVFSDDLIPLEKFGSPDETAILAHFSIAPALPGTFRFLTPRMIGFEADRAWPVATRVRVTIAKGIRGLHGRALAGDLAWTFQTGAIKLDQLPGQPDDSEPLDLRPKIAFTSNVALDRPSLEAHALLRSRDAKPVEIPLVVPPDTATPLPGMTPSPDVAYDPSNDDWSYVLVPASELARGTQYDIEITPGLAPRDGNLASDRTFTGTFHTYDALRFEHVDLSHPERFASGDPMLAFTTPIDPASIGALTLSPAPPPGTTPFAVVDREVSVNTSLLDPQKTYTVTIGAGLKDSFGQQLGSPQRATFRTGDYAPDVWAPSGTNLFPSGRDVRLNVVAVNAPPTGATFRALQPFDVVQNGDPSGGDQDPLLGTATDWPSFDVRAAHNVERTIEVPLRAKLGAPAGVLAYGVESQLSRSQGRFIATGVVLLTDLGAFAQFFPDGGSVRVNRIADGSPVGGAQVAIYPSQIDAQKKTTPVACATASTDPAGVATFGGAAFARCAEQDRGDNDAPSFVTIVRKGADWTYVRTDAYSGAFTGDVYNGWSSAAPQAAGTIFSDRDLYQPGETAQLTAAGWFLVDGVLRHGVAPSYEVVLQLPNGRKRDLGRRSLDAFGMFSLPVTLDAGTPLGNYQVHASAGNGETIDGSFRVAVFKPPNFKVDVALSAPVVQRGTSVTAGATSAYLFGAPLAGASTAYTVTRSPVDFTPPGRDDYSFGRRWYWPEHRPDASTDVLQTTVTDDAGGKSSVSVPVASDLPYPMEYAVDAETTDASNISVADGKIFTALPSDTLIGLRTDDVGTAGSPLSTAVIVTDPSGKAQPGTKVHVELQSETYATATQIVEGAEQQVESVTYATVAGGDAVSAATASTVALTPPKPGAYRVRATLAGNDAAAETDVEVYVGGSGATAWYGESTDTLTVKLDKKTYKPGDIATALVQSPFPSAELHLTVVRHGVLWETTQTTSSAAPTVRFRVTPQMLPNAAVQAFLVRRGPPPAKAPAGGGNALARTGLTGFEVALDAKYLHATVMPKTAKLEPGARQTVTVRLQDAGHRPIAGEVTLVVANDAVLQLTGYRLPDLVKTVYADQPISTRFSDDRSALVLNTLARPAEKGWGFGGGLSSEEADPRVRHTFSPLAYFAGALRTDANGVATATFTLPDDLTTWRAMVVASSADGRFGNAESTFTTTKPLVANPVIPQFARPGDQFDAGVEVTNGTGASGSLRVDASLTGPLAFLVNGKPVASTTLETPLDTITKAYRFTMVAQGTGTSTATVKVRGAGTGDAFAIPVPVTDTDVSESVAQTGTTNDRASIPLDVAAGTPRDAGGLDLSLASSLLPELTVAAQSALLGDDRLALSSASRLDVAADVLLLAGRTGDDTSKTRARAVAELGTLRGLARGDGGFAAYWQEQGSDPWDSLVALRALARAKAAGVAVPGPLLDGARTYATAVLGDPVAHVKWCDDTLCKAELRLDALVALDAAGRPSTTFLDDIDALSDRLTFADQARLA